MNKIKLYWPGLAFRFEHAARRFDIPSGDFEVEKAIAQRLLMRHAADGLSTYVPDVAPEETRRVAEERYQATVRLGGQARQPEQDGDPKVGNSVRGDQPGRHRSSISLRGGAGAKLRRGTEAAPPSVTSEAPKTVATTVQRVCGSCGATLPENFVGGVLTCDACAIKQATSAQAPTVPQVASVTSAPPVAAPGTRRRSRSTAKPAASRKRK